MDRQLLDKDAEEEFLLRVAINELKLSENDDLIVENEKLNENIGDNDVEEIEPEMANEEKRVKNKARSLTFSVLESRIKICDNRNSLFLFSKIQLGFRASDIIFRKIPKCALEPRALEPPLYM